MSAHFFCDLLRQDGSAVVHGQQDSCQVKGGVQVLLNAPDGVEQLRNTLQCVVLALNRNEHLTCGSECVDGQESERGRAVDEEVVDVIVLHEVVLHRVTEHILATIHGGQLEIGAGQVDCRRHTEQPFVLRGLLHDIFEGAPSISTS